MACQCTRFHPTYNTGGSDATVSVWDHKVKKRLRQYTKYNTPVAALAFSADGARLAIGAGYTWDAGEEGARTAERPSLFVRELGEEVKVRLLLWPAGCRARSGLEHSSFLFPCSRRDGVLDESDDCCIMSGGLVMIQVQVRRYPPICLLAGSVQRQYGMLTGGMRNAYSSHYFLARLHFTYLGLSRIMLRIIAHEGADLSHSLHE